MSNNNIFPDSTPEAQNEATDIGASTAAEVYAAVTDLTDANDLGYIANHVEQTKDELMGLFDLLALDPAQRQVLRDALTHLDHYATELAYEQERCG